MATLEIFQRENLNSDHLVQDDSKLVSIIIPTYNRSALVTRAIKSIINQTYTEIEVIVVDDSSTDNTHEQIESLRQIDQRIKYFRHNNNQGAQAARNTGIKESRGHYIAFLDSDNEWLPHKLESQMKLFLNDINSPDVVYCGYKKISITGEVVHEYIPQFRGEIYKQCLSKWLTDTSTVLVQKNVLGNIHNFDEKVHAYQEWDLCIRLARDCVFDFVPESLVLYYEHELTSISKDFLRDAYGYLFIVEKYHKEILQECGTKILSAHYLQIGRLFIRADQFKLARIYFLRSIRYNQINFKAIAHLVVSLLGKPVYHLLRSLKHALFLSTSI